MNARQKAKHFKKLYEELLYRQPHKHQYRVEVDRDFVREHEPEIEAQIEHRMLQILRPYTDKYIINTGWRLIEILYGNMNRK